MSDIKKFISERALRAGISCKSHIVTVFGDVVSPHGGWIWLGSLIESLQPLGFSERLIRTSVYRLVQDDWLQVNKVGRRSFYAFTSTANRHYTKAARRIYSLQHNGEDSGWLIVMPSFVPEDKLVSLKRQLQWLGFSPLTSGAYAHPSIDADSLKETIQELDISDAVIIFSSHTFDSDSQDVLRKLVFEKWQVDQLQHSYQTFIDCYQPIYEVLNKQHKLTDQQGFLLRSLLIHEYRRILLRDHELPKNLLPENWAGNIAANLVGDFYCLLTRSSSRYIGNHLYNEAGLLPTASDDYKKRFR
ncbi:PaaX family transcriptional regulator C-terminal domain-containing protein [Aliikangiella maris]|uniref:PaaX family transcriptional regulator C-terminal domain-containing protein n=2 Tax=Aliikangiella maris TaxID=3162458 RepID=A0ABV3MKF7_9GAMM